MGRMVQLTVTQSHTVHSDEAHGRKQSTEGVRLVSAEHPNVPVWQTACSSGVIHTRSLGRHTAAFGGRGKGRKRKEEKEEEEVSDLNHKSLPPSAPSLPPTG